MRQARHTREQAGFTLIELLLTVVILGLLLGAMVWTFSSSRLHVEHAEGVRRFESLLRFARAEAQQRGRTLRLEISRDEDSFDEETPDDRDRSTPRLLWEPDPLGAPGEFEPLPSTASWIGGLAAILEVERVRLLDADEEPEDRIGRLLEEGRPVDWTDSPPMPSVLFFADGSSDSAEFTLVSHDRLESHRTLVRLVGITGFVTHDAVDTDRDDTFDADLGNASAAAGDPR